MIYRAILNKSNLNSVARLQKLHAKNPNEFLEESIKAVDLLIRANLKDGNINITYPTGMVWRSAIHEQPEYRRMTVSIFDNIISSKPEIRSSVQAYFTQAKGVYKRRIKESINPLFWIEYILKLPTHIMKYLGLDEQNLFIKIIQLLYWILGIVKILHELKIISFQF